MMCPTGPMFQVLCLIMLQIILNVEKGRSSVLNNHTTSSKLARSKRLTAEHMLNELKIRVRYETGEEIDLIWIKQHSYIANQNLPIKVPAGYPNPNVMKDVGEFVVYFDIVRCSAVVYYVKFHSFFGNIGMNYVVTELPYKFNVMGEYPGVVGAPFVWKHQNVLLHLHPLFDDPLFGSHLGQSTHELGVTEQSSDVDAGPSGKRQRTERDLDEKIDDKVTMANVSNINHIRKRRWNSGNSPYYLETLIFVTHDIAEAFKGYYGADEYIEWIVRCYILIFNIVDMLFQKLQIEGLFLRINIAEIIIQDEVEAFDFMRNDQCEFDDIVSNVQQYLSIHQFPPDSFDYVFVSTRRQILRNTALVPAATKLSGDVYKARIRQFYSAIPITAMNFDTEHVLIAQEIGLTLEIKVDEWQKGLTHNGQCHSIMQKGSSKCNKCLTWSHDNQEQFIDFFKYNLNRCFLLNEPRSLRPIGPSIFITPRHQCQCFGYESYAMQSNGKSRWYVCMNECWTPLQCEKHVNHQLLSEFTLPPLDGTRCAPRKVCWGGKCISLRKREC